MEAKRSKTKLVVSLLALGSTLAFLAFCLAGDPDLDVPTAPGPGISVKAQLISSLPLTIDESGSYYLDQNMRHSSRYTNAIEVNVDDVTIDLRGHSLIGRSSSSGTSNGIYMNGRKNVEIRNGTITNFGNNGIWEEDTDEIASGHRVIGVRVLSNGGNGIKLRCGHNLVKDCTVSYNCSAIDEGWGGIFCGFASTIIDNVVSYNSGLCGIVTGAGCMISGNNVSDNGWGISTYHGCHVIGNTCSWNIEEIEIDGNANLVKGNTVFDGLSGIKVSGFSNAIEENLVTYCGIGIYFSDAQNFYANNRALNNLINYGGSVPTGSGDGGGNVEYIISEVNNNAELRRNMEKDRQKRARTQ